MFHGIYADPAEATVVVRLTFGPGHDFELVIDPEEYDDDSIPFEGRLFPVGMWSAPFNPGTLAGDKLIDFLKDFAAGRLGATMIEHLGKIEMVKISVRTPFMLIEDTRR